MAQPDPLKIKLESLLAEAKEPEAAGEALAMLFPRVARLIDAVVSVDPEQGNQRTLQRRISKQEFSSAYFRLSPDPIVWGRSELDELATSSDPQSAFAKLFERLDAASVSDQPRLLRIFLETLEATFQAGKKINHSWLRAILDEAENILKYEGQKSSSFLSFGNSDRLRILIITSLRELGTGDRDRLVSDVISEARDISILCDIFRSIAGDLPESGARGGRYGFDFGPSTGKLRAQLLDRVKWLANRGAIWSQSKPENLLWFWWGCGQEVEVRAFLADEMKSLQGLECLLNVPVTTVHSTGGDYEHVNVEAWSKIVNLGELEAAAHRLNVPSEDERRQAQANRFLKALEKGRRGI